MIEEGFCVLCGRRFDADPHRGHDDMEHYDCRDNSKILQNLGISKEDIKRSRAGENVITTEKYWVCECGKKYIHRKSEYECDKCGAIRDRQPDSRINEVIDHGLSLK